MFDFYYCIYYNSTYKSTAANRPYKNNLPVVASLMSEIENTQLRNSWIHSLHLFLRYMRGKTTVTIPDGRLDVVMVVSLVVVVEVMVLGSVVGVLAVIVQVLRVVEVEVVVAVLMVVAVLLMVVVTMVVVAAVQACLILQFYKTYYYETL